MFIQTELTPNPNAVKFLPGLTINNGEPQNYFTKTECTNSPLASLLFDIEGVKGVFIGYDFITITKEELTDWEVIKPEVLVTIMDYLMAGNKAVTSEAETLGTEDEDPLIRQIKEIIEHRVRPAVAQDGGDIVFREFKDGIVMLELYGSCSGCPSSSVTLKNGIESMLKHYVPEVIAVEAVNG